MTKLCRATGNYRYPVSWSTGYDFTVLILRIEKKKYFIILTKNNNFILEMIDKSLYSFVDNKTATKIWTLFENRFQYIFTISVTYFYKHYGNKHPNFTYFNQKKLQCLPNYTTTPTIYDNNFNTEIAR